MNHTTRRRRDTVEPTLRQTFRGTSKFSAKRKSYLIGLSYLVETFAYDGYCLGERFRIFNKLSDLCHSYAEKKFLKHEMKTLQLQSSFSFGD